MASERDDERGVGALGLDVAVPRESTVEQAQAAPGASSASTTAPTTPGTAAVNGILSGSGSVGSPRTTKHTTFAEPPASESDQQQQQQRPRFARTRSNGSNSNGGGGDRVYTAPGWHQAAQARRNELLESLRRDVSPTDRSGFPDHQDGGPAAGTGPEGGQDGDGDDDGKRGRRGRKGATRETVEKTIDDLRQLLQTFRSFIPSSLRRMGRIVIPTPLRELVRAIVRQVAVMLHRRGALASNVFYDCQVLFWKSIINIFFREIWSRGAWKVPPLGQGAVIFVVGPHHNQFLDPLLLMSEVRRESGRRISFLIAEKSMKRKFIGQAARLMQSISVVRAQDMARNGTGTVMVDKDDPCTLIGTDTHFKKEFESRMQIMLSREYGNVCAEIVEVIDDTHLRLKKELNKKATDQLIAKGQPTRFKCLPHVDQTRMYSSVYQKLKEGGSLGIFPEGGSHDRTDLLPLKAGVSIMALGAISANPDLKLAIVPVGLSYFHPHRFRSRAVVEFGSPIAIPREHVRMFEQGGDDKRTAINKVMDLVVDGLKSVTVRAPDVETLMLIQATRRLYRPPGAQLSLGHIVELNKRFIAGYEVYKDEPKVQALRERVKQYNTLLRHMGLKDHQVERVGRPFWRSLFLLGYRFGLLTVWGGLALPGVILNSPIFLAASIISRKKAREALAASDVKIKGNDVLATWKVLVALAGAPLLYTTYAIGATVLAFKLNLSLRYKIWAPFATLAGLPIIGYSALKFGEVGMDVYKSLRPLFFSLWPGSDRQMDRLREMRASLQQDISEVVNEFGPQLFDDFQATRIVPQATPPPPSPSPFSPTLTRRKSTGHGHGRILKHPLTWVDEYLFGWSANAPPRTPLVPESEGAMSEGAIPSGYISGYTTEGEHDYDEVIGILSREVGENTELNSRLRRRSRSQLNLTALNQPSPRSQPTPLTPDTPRGFTSAVPEQQEGLTMRSKRNNAASDEQ